MTYSTVADGEPRAGLKAWLLVAVLVSFYIFAVMDRAVISMLVDPIRADLGISDTQIALLMGVAYAAAYAGAALPMGYLVDKISRKWVLYVAVSFWGLAEAACGVATGFGPLFLARMGVGLGESPLNPSAHSLISDTFPKRKLATAMSVYSTGALLGTGAALVLGGWIVSTLMARPLIELPLIGAVKPWQVAFIVTGLPGLALALLILPFREPKRAVTRKIDGEGSWPELWAFLAKNWQVALCFFVAFGGMNIVNGAFIKWEPSYLGRFYHLKPAEYGSLLGLLHVTAGISGMLFSGWFVDRAFSRGARTAHIDYYLGSLLIATPVVIYGLLSHNLYVYLATTALSKFALINFIGFFSALVQLISPPRLRGRMSAIFLLMVMALLGSSLGPLIPALISERVFHDEIHLGKSLAATLCIFAPLAVIAMIWGRRHVRQAVDDARAWA